MTITDEQVGQRLRAQVDSIDAPGDLALDASRLGGRRRATRRRAVQAISGLAAVAVGSTVILTQWPADDGAGPVARAGTDTVTADELERAFAQAVVDVGGAAPADLTSDTCEVRCEEGPFRSPGLLAGRWRGRAS